MKRIITLFAVLVATASAAHAQSDSLVVFDTQGDKLGISIAGFNISLGETAKEKYTDEYIYHEPRRKKIVTNFLGLGFGGMVLTSSPYYGPWESERDILGIYPASSTRIDVTFDIVNEGTVNAVLSSFVKGYAKSFIPALSNNFSCFLAYVSIC